MRARSSAVLVCSGITTFRDSIPTRRQALPFIFTYVAEAGSSPTRIVARMGERPPVRSRIFETR